MHPDLATLLTLIDATDDDGRAALRYLLDILEDRDLSTPELREVRHALRTHAAEQIASWRDE